VAQPTRASKAQIELERPVFRTFIFAAAVATFGMAAGAPAAAKIGSAQSSYSDGRLVNNVAMLDGKPGAKPRRKAKRVLRCAIFGRYIPGCAA
jgi:hypothetical protein